MGIVRHQKKKKKKGKERRSQLAWISLMISCQKFRIAKMTILFWLIVKLTLYCTSHRRCVPNEMINVLLSGHYLAHCSLAVTLLLQQQHSRMIFWTVLHILCITCARGKTKLGVFLHARTHTSSANSYFGSPKRIRWQEKQAQLIVFVNQLMSTMVWALPVGRKHDQNHGV